MTHRNQRRKPDQRRWPYLLGILAVFLAATLTMAAVYTGNGPDGDLLVNSLDQEGLGQGDPLLELPKGKYKVLTFHRGEIYTDFLLERENESRFSKHYTIRTDLVNFDDETIVKYRYIQVLKGTHHEKITFYMDP